MVVRTLTRVEIKFQLEKPIAFQSFSGFSSRGLLYEMLRGVDVEYAEMLHSSPILAPFSSTPIYTLTPKGWAVVYKRLPAPSICKVCFTLMNREIAARVFEALANDIPLRLQGVEVLPLEVSLEQIKYSNLLEKAKPVRDFTIDFLTPTYFRFSPLIAARLFPFKLPLRGVDAERLKRARRFHPLPEPIMLMRSILRLWRNYSDTHFNYARYSRWITSMGIALSGFPEGIKTMRLYEHKTLRKFIVGFLGSVHYSIPEDLYKKRWARITDALLRFAEYTNVGGGRTAGLGMIKYVPKETKSTS